MFEIDDLVCADKETICRDSGDSSVNFIPYRNFPKVLEAVNDVCDQTSSVDETEILKVSSQESNQDSSNIRADVEHTFKSEQESDNESDENQSNNKNRQNIKEEASTNEATEDESMAVEALWQLGGGGYNENETPHVGTPVKVDVEKPSNKIEELSPVTRTNNSVNTCESCQQSFTSLEDLKIHNGICEKHLKSIYSCTICSETFDKKLNFNNHMICHQVARPYSCRSCGSLFKLKADFQDHACLQAVRNYYCHICGVEFTRSSSLTNHMKVHTYVPGRALMAAAIASGDPDIVTSANPNQWTPPECSTLPPMLPQLDIQPTLFLNQTEVNQPEMSTWNMNMADNLSSEDIPESMDIAQETTVNTTYSIDSQSSEFQDDFEQLDPISGNAECEYSLIPDKKITGHNENYSLSLSAKASVKVEILPVIPASLEANSVGSAVNTDQSKIDSINKKKPHVCRSCGVGFTRAKALVSHERLHEDYWNDNFECIKCGDTFSDNRTLKNHLCNAVNHQSADIMQNLSLPNKVNIKEKNIIVKPAIVENELHLDDFIIEEDFDETALSVDSNKTKQNNKHTCLQCSKRFTTKQKMFRHMWIHRKKTFCCEVCSETFSLQTQLDEHRLAMHPSNTPHGCTSCGKCFASRQGLWEHARAHREGAAPHRCPLCPKRFASRQGFLIHSRTHTGERPYGCRYCWKAFRDGGTLRKHERIHTGERPHACPLCMRAFNQKVVLREHVRWVHAATQPGGSEPHFACPLCPQLLADREDLCAHIVKHSDILAAQDKQNAAEPAVQSGRKLTTPKLTVKKDIFPENTTSKTADFNFYSSSFSSSESFPPIDSLEMESVEFPCDMCGDLFDSKESLVSHIRIHI